MQLVKGKEREYLDWRRKSLPNVNDEIGYSNAIFEYAERWAALMEVRVANGEDLSDIAHETKRDSDIDGVTGFMYGRAVATLANFWIHGEELRRWHNLDWEPGERGKQANKEGTVINPAVLNIRLQEQRK